tara:strand:+ start:1867 stop:2100 length:234 start_codon:yes stop_codon:yes gene_type:complete
MNNGDMPAVPCDNIVRRDDNGNLYGAPISSAGLTKREHFSALAMQAFISAGVNGMPSSDEVAFLAVGYADALLKDLE